MLLVKNSNSSFTLGRMEELFIEYFLFAYICNTIDMANNSYTCKNIAFEIGKLDKGGPIDTLKSARYKTVGAMAYLMNRVHKKSYNLDIFLLAQTNQNQITKIHQVPMVVNLSTCNVLA